MTGNPYVTPSDTNVDSYAGGSEGFTVEISHDALDTLKFTGKLIRGVSVFCLIGSALYLWSTVMGFYYLGLYDGWTWLHTIQAFRLLFVPTMALLGVFGWKYATVMSRLAKGNLGEIRPFATAQGLFWLLVVLHVFIIVCGIGLTVLASYTYAP